jgi:hypothetical protein
MQSTTGVIARAELLSMIASMNFVLYSVYTYQALLADTTTNLVCSDVCLIVTIVLYDTTVWPITTTAHITESGSSLSCCASCVTVIDKTATVVLGIHNETCDMTSKNMLLCCNTENT